MAYQPLTLKYRPQTFDDLIGQPHIVQTLKNELVLSKIVNAYLFAGPHGTGKTTTARLLAKALNCVNGPTPKPCNECDSCKEIQSGTSLDVFEIDGASNRGIDEVRELREKIRYSPARRKHKIYVIDEVHMLTEPAFNALLKTLEEPPKHAIFVLATTSPYKIPATIASRCQRFNFRKVNLKELIDRIKYIAKLENIEIEDNASSLLAQKVDGAVRDAVSMLDQLASYSSGKIKEIDVQILLGIPTPKMLAELTNSIIKKNPSSIILTLQSILNQGIPPEEIILNIINYFQILFMIKIKALSNPLPSDVEQAGLFKTQHLLTLLNFFFDAEKGIKNTPSPELYLEQALVRASMCTQLQIDELLSNLSSEPISLSGAGAGNKMPELKPTSTPPYLGVVQDIDTAEINKLSTINQVPTVTAHKQKVEENIAPLSDKPVSVEPESGKPVTPIGIWNSIVNRVSKESYSLGSVLLHSKLIRLTDKELCISYQNDFVKEQLQQKKSLLESVAKEIIGRQVYITLEPELTPTSQTHTALRHKDLLEEPIVKTTIEMFNAEPVLE